MYEWSKDIISKIENADCLTDKELRIVETALRMNDIYDELLNESLGMNKTNKYELKYKID